MKALLAPVHTNLNPSYSSESAWAYNIMSRLAENFNTIFKHVKINRGDKPTE